MINSEIIDKFKIFPANCKNILWENFKGNIIPTVDGKLIHSKYEPEKEAKKICKNILQKTVIVYGIGGGYYIKELLEMDKKIILIETNKDFFSSALENIDLTFILDKNIKFIISQDLKCINEFIVNNYYPIFDGGIYVLNIPSFKYVYNDYDNFLNIVLSTIEYIKSEYQTYANFSKIWALNTLKNLEFYKKYKNNIFEKYKNIDTVYIFGAGNSFDVDSLEIGKNDLVISTDTSYKVLLNQGIKPNIVINIDSQFYSNFHFIATPPLDVDFLFLLSSPFSIVRHYSKLTDNINLILSPNPLLQLIYSRNGGIFLEKIGVNVGETCIFIASLFLPKKIVCYGIDFRIIKGVMYHKGTDKEFEYISKQNRYLTYATMSSSYLSNSDKLGDDYYTDNMNYYLNSLKSKISDDENIPLTIKSLNISSSVSSKYLKKMFNDDFSYLKNMKLNNIEKKMIEYTITNMAYFISKRNKDLSLEDILIKSKQLFIEMINRYL